MRNVILGLAALAATPAAAQTADRTGFTAIEAGDYAAAERTLMAERRIFPQRPELMLNLAAVYRHNGREADAHSLYASVLSQPVVLMDLPNQQVASSHALAEAGLRRTMQVAAR